MSAGRRWFITGVSGGMGRLVAEAALARGDTVAGTLRNPDQAREFEALAPGRAHAVLLDVTDRQRISAAVAEGVASLGGIDILLNNAGYGLAGALEECDEEEIDHAIATNLIGVIYVTRAALPALRESKGRIVNISSMAGYMGMPGMAPYCAAKFGVEGFSEAIAAELQPFGIRVTVVAPGGFRTNFFKGSERIARNPLAIYDGTPGGITRSSISGIGDHMPGDPAKAAQAILALADADNPPMHLALGADAVGLARSSMKQMETNLAEWEALSLSTAHA